MFKDFKPLNPWGRPMPRPSRPALPARPPLYQVHVEAAGKIVPYGPKITLEGAEVILAGLNAQIINGRLKGWGNAHLIQVRSN